LPSTNDRLAKYAIISENTPLQRKRREVGIMSATLTDLSPDMDLSLCGVHGHRHVILHLPAKFCSNRMNVGGVMTSYRFSTWRP